MNNRRHVLHCEHVFQQRGLRNLHVKYHSVVFGVAITVGNVVSNEHEHVSCSGGRVLKTQVQVPLQYKYQTMSKK